MKNLLWLILLTTLGCEDTQLIRLECVPNTTRECHWEENSTQIALGECSMGVEVCTSAGWSECRGAQGPEEETNKHQALILGDGHILCNNEKGNISVGDGICTSTTAGIGMKADKMAMIIGIAQEDVTFTGSETKLVPVQYGLQQFTPWT